MAKEKCFYCGLPIYRTESKVYTDTGEFAWKHSGLKSKKSGWFTCAFALEEHGKTAINKFYASSYRASLEENDYKREVEDYYNKVKVQKNPILLMPSVTLLKTAQPNPQKKKHLKKPTTRYVCKHCGKSEDDPVAEVRVTIDIEGRKFKT